MTIVTREVADSELLRAYSRERDAEAFAELVRRYAGMVYGTALRVTRSDADAQDVSQECFLTLASQARRGRWSARSLPGWLHSLAHSRAIDALRRTSARQRHELQTPPVEQRPGLAEWERMQPHIDSAIATLPEEMRELVTRHYLCGVPQSELAELTGMSQATISRRLGEAVQQLREGLDAAGVTLSAGVVAEELVRHGQTEVPAALQRALGKMAITGVGVGAAVGGITAKVIVATVAVVAAVGTWQLVTRPAPAAKGTSMQSRSAPAVELPRNFAMRIVSIPPLKMARSGNTDLMAFDQWWMSTGARGKLCITPRDYMWSSPKTGKEEWLYALPPGVSDTGGYETLNFAGGLYVVIACREADIGNAYEYARNWVRQSGFLEQDERTVDRYPMGHVITPKMVKQKLGFNQMDLFVPVVLKGGAAKANLLERSFAIRLVEFPPLTMVRSGDADPEQFKQWMASIDQQDKYSNTPRGFLWHNRQTGTEEWIYALPYGVNDTGGYEKLQFGGGLYAATCCRESELPAAGQYVRDWVSRSGSYRLDEAGPDRYSMYYNITPDEVATELGFSQMDFFIPIAQQ